MNDLSATDRCVKCGLCLPHCPTFRITGNEADSPRGRISLMQAIEQGESGWSSPGLFRHLDQCLQCRACEAMCPSRVPFGALMDSAQERLEPHRKRTAGARLARRVGLKLAASPRALGVTRRLLRVYQRSRLDRLVAAAPWLPTGFRRLHVMLPAVPPRQATRRSAAVARQPVGDVHLFPGCASHVFDAHTFGAARQLLERLGYRIIPQRQGHCCGALHRHAGDTAGAASLAASNLKRYAQDSHPILVTATGCTTHLRDYDRLYPQAAIQHFSARVTDVLHFILALDTAALRFDSLPETVAVYVPCSHRNVLKQERDIAAAIGCIPDTKTVVVNPEGGCCGAAGSYMLSQPALSDQLRDAVIDRLAQSGARLLVTTNIGCSLQLQAGLKQRGIAMEVVHPLTLLARQLEAA